MVAFCARVAVVAFPVNGPLKLPAVIAPETVIELKSAFPPSKPLRYSHPAAFLIYNPEGSVVIYTIIPIGGFNASIASVLGILGIKSPLFVLSSSSNEAREIVAPLLPILICAFATSANIRNIPVRIRNGTYSFFISI